MPFLTNYFGYLDIVRLSSGIEQIPKLFWSTVDCHPECPGWLTLRLGLCTVTEFLILTCFSWEGKTSTWIHIHHTLNLVTRGQRLQIFARVNLCINIFALQSVRKMTIKICKQCFVCMRCQQINTQETAAIKRKHFQIQFDFKSYNLFSLLTTVAPKCKRDFPNPRLKWHNTWAVSLRTLRGWGESSCN